jgi:hypothetical protein
MSKKRLAIIIWVVAGFLLFIVGSAVGNATSNSQSMLGGTTPSSQINATDLPLPVDSSTPTPTTSAKPAPKPAPKPAGPATFVMPDFTDMDENEVDAWFSDRNIDVSTEFDYGDQEGTDCADAGDGIVDDQNPVKGTRLKNSISTDVYLSVYCDY